MAVDAQRDVAQSGTVSLALARGSKGGKYRSIGKTKISSKSTFSKRFTQRRTGTYRLRVHYAGSSLAPPATITYKIRITRRLFYRRSVAERAHVTSGWARAAVG